MRSFAALTPERWPDVERLFGPRGASAGCWCMWWRLTRREFEERKGERNHGDFAAIVAAGREPGVIAYEDGEPVGWCAVEPRSAYPSLNRSPVARPVDDQPVWAVPCIFVQRSHRRRGLSVALLEAACAHAAERGAPALEGYPLEPRTGAMPDAFAWTGTVAAFRAAGFEEVARHRPGRPVMRRALTRDGTKLSPPVRPA